MNYRMYSDRAMEEENFTMPLDIPMEDDVEMPVINGVHNHEMPMDENNNMEYMTQMYGAMPWEGEKYHNPSMEYMEDFENMEDMKDMKGYMQDNRDNPEYIMANMMPCCMMNNMSIMPYMVELEEDEEDEKCDDDILDIAKKIEKHHPEVLTILSSYGIPYDIGVKIVRRIARLTLKHK